MAQARNGRSQIERFPDHDIITPVNKLEKAIAKVVLPDDDPLARAQAALAHLSGEFGDWMTAECERLDTARHAVKEHGFGKSNLDELFFAAHDVKGDAATFGFPLAAAAAESLCRVIEHSPDSGRIPVALVDQHVDRTGDRARVRAARHRGDGDGADPQAAAGHGRIPGARKPPPSRIYGGDLVATAGTRLLKRDPIG